LSKQNIASADSANSGILGQALGKLARALRSSPSQPERRRRQRLPAHGELKLQWRAKEGAEREVNVHAIDISPLGMAFRSRAEVPIGRAVALFDGTAVLSGQVRHCTPDGDEFTIGIEVERLDRPEHRDTPAHDRDGAAVVLACIAPPQSDDLAH
jgi:hypothetical protein